VIRVNSETDVPRYGPRLNFLVGGNILGRGLTIDDLLVTYYVREAQVSQMDTIWQHARMYGYRLPLWPYTRLYLPRRIAARFKEVHEAEALRDLLRREAAGEEVLVRVATGTRPTRPNATEPNILRVIGAGLDQLFPRFLVEDEASAMLIRESLVNADVPIGVGDRTDRATTIPLDLMLELIDLLPIVDGDPGNWRGGAISTLVDFFRDQYRGRATIYVRGLIERPPQEGWIRGRLGGPEITIIRAAAQATPALALMYTGQAERPLGWYPTLVLPPNTPAFILNPL
jgi:hypothetical protein